MVINVFNKWSVEEIKVEDDGLKDYINLRPRIVPKTGSRYAGYRFRQNKTFIVERLINKMMIPGHKAKKHKISSGHCTDKTIAAYSRVEKTFMIIEKKLGKNPIGVFVKALENAAPREGVVTIEYGGARYPKAVEISPQRRIDYALRLMCQSAYQKAFNSKKSIIQTLSDEIINAYNLSPNSAAIAKKQELERQSDSAR